MPTQGELGVDEILHCYPPQLLEPSSYRTDRCRVREPAQRFSSPQLEGNPELLRDRSRVVQGASLIDQRFEPQRVHRLALDSKLISGRTSNEAVGLASVGEHTSQFRYERVQRVRPTDVVLAP